MNNYRAKIKQFVNSPAHHDLEIKEIAAIYGVTTVYVRHNFCPPIGRELRSVKFNRIREEIMCHALFGETGERAPVSTPRLSAMTGVSVAIISKLRKKIGVRACSKGYDRTPGDRPVRGGKWANLIWSEIQTYKFCGRVNKQWNKRPAGIDAHLEELRHAGL